MKDVIVIRPRDWANRDQGTSADSSF